MKMITSMRHSKKNNFKRHTCLEETLLSGISTENLGPQHTVSLYDMRSAITMGNAT